MVGMGAMGLISLYQVGLLKHLPDLPGKYFNADLVDASAEAYEKLSAPDAVLGMASYATTAVLAAMDSSDRAVNKPWLPLALAGKSIFDVLNAGKLTIDQWTKHKAFCIWCLIGAGATFLTLPLVFPEAKQALQALKVRNKENPLAA